MGVKSFDKADPSKKQIEIYQDFSGGINTELADSAMKDNQFRKLVNFDLDAAGSIKKRDGLYRIPFVRQQIEAMLKKKYGVNKGNEIASKIIINDVVEFFDGAHWVFNYITNYGLIVLLLDKTMSLPQDLNLQLFEHVLFYPMSKIDEQDTYNVIGDKVKISPYNDTYIMYATKYSNANGLVNIDEKQIKMFSWNPINDDDQTIGGNVARPQWIEAVENQDDVETITYYGDTTPISIVSNNFGFVNDYEGNNTLSIEVPLALKSLYDYYDYFKIEYKHNNTQAWIQMDYILNGEQSTTNIFIKSPRGDYINPKNIASLFIHESGRIIIRLSNKVKCLPDTTYMRAILHIFRDICAYNDYRYNSVYASYEACNNSFTYIDTLVIDLKKRELEDYNDYNKFRFVIEGEGHLHTMISNWFLGFTTYTYSDEYPPSSSASVHKHYPSRPILTYYLGLYDSPIILPNEQNFTEVNDEFITYLINTYGWDKDKYYYLELIKDPNWCEWSFTNDTITLTITHIGYKNSVKNQTTMDITLFNHKGLPILNNHGPLLFYNIKGLFNDDGKLHNPTIKKEINIDNDNKLIKQGSYRTNSYTLNIEDTIYSFDTPMIANASTGDGSAYRTKISYLGVSYCNDLTKLSNIVVIDSKESNYQYYYKLEQLYGNWESNNAKRRSLQFAGNQASYQFDLTTINLLDYNENNSPTNILNKDGTLGLFSVACKVNNINVSSSSYNGKDKCIWEKLLPSNVINWANFNNIDENALLAINRETILPVDLFSINDIKLLFERYYNNQLTNMKVIYYIGTQWSDISIPYYNLGNVLKNLYNNVPIQCEYTKNSTNFYSFDLFYIINNEKIYLLRLKQNELNGLDFNNLHLSLDYYYLPNGVENVLKFQHQQYVKPNLNDLNYLSYNLNLFSRFNQSRFPAIYNKDIHHNISSDLVKYPKLDITQQNNYIQLFGIFPVNDIILEPNKQKFQLFYSLQNNQHPDDLIIALTTMTVADYNQMVNSKDYSTTGYTSNTDNTGETKCIGPNWTPFNTFFSDDVSTSYNDSLDDDNPPKPAIFTVDVPDTTEPYLILIQVAQRDDKYDGENVPKLATVVETRIQMSPNTSYRDRLDIVSLFDEYTATNNLTTYSTNLIAYGQTNKLYFSDNAIPSYFPLTRAIQLKTPEAIKKCSLFQNKLIVSTENTKNFISGSSFDSENDPFILSSISTDTGLIAPKSEVPVGDLLFFLDKGGVKYLKNVAASYYKEFSYKQADEIIKSIVPIDKDACGISYNDKYYLCFPNNRIMLIFNTTFRCWTMYQSEYLDFAKMFVNDGELYGISRNTFNIFKFDKNVYVDNWNELEDDEIYIDNSGYETISNANGEEIKVQKGTPIMCIMETKNLDQNYLHRKKYSWALLSTHTYNKDDDSMYVASNSSLKPYVLLDENLINYTFDSYDKVNNTIIYNQDKTSPYDILVRDGSALNVSAMVDYQKLGYNNTNSYFNIPIRRKGNSIAFGFTFKEPCGLIINSLSIKYGLQDIKRNKGGKS